jgi:thiamine biosynthesis protein ThiI
VLSFTAVQERIKERADHAWTTLMLRMAMFEAAAYAASTLKSRCLVTGESLAQVASQTLSNINCAESILRAEKKINGVKAPYTLRPMPVIRPLIGLDKEWTMARARRMGTYETSVLPYEDCCVLFSPEHPVLDADVNEALEMYHKCDLDFLIAKSIDEREICKFHA